MSKEKPKTINLTITGSRSITSYDTCLAALNRLVELNLLPQDISNVKLYHGAAKGVDLTVKEIFDDNNLQSEAIPADWSNLDVEPCVIKYNRYGKAYNALAGINRNKTLVDKGDLTLAIWDGKSSGTKDAMNYAESQGKLALVYKV